MPERYRPKKRSWATKFGEAFSALYLGMVGQSSFAAHIAAAIAVFGCAIWFRISAIEWVALVICVTLVMAAEMFNRAIEVLSRAVTKYVNRDVEFALNVASAAVLITAIGATIVGGIIFVPYLLN